VLAGIWQELLKLPRIGRHDNFFELGGHSLMAVKLAVHIGERWAIKVAVSAVFRYPTVQQMAEVVQSLVLKAEAPATSREHEVEEGII
jgi:acyl carrier protein